MKNKIKKIALLAVGDEAWIGGIQYIVNILDALNATSKNEPIEIHLFKNEHQKFDSLEYFKNINISIVEINEVLPDYNIINRLWWYFQRKFLSRVYPRLENYLLKNKFDYVYPATISSCNGQLNVGSWIADFQYHNFPTGHNKETNLLAKEHISKIANDMSKIIFSSKYCWKQSHDLFPATINKSFVLPFTVYINKNNLQNDDLQKIRAKYGLIGPYLIVSNLFAMVKNHKILFEALSILKNKGVIIPLVCTGNFVNYAQMEFTNEILKIINMTGIRHQLYILGLIPREDQIALYRMAVAMVQPSKHEGWSTCVEEAKCLGKTIIVSDIDVHKEQNPEYGIFFDPDNAQQLSEIIEVTFENHSNIVYPILEVEEDSYNNYRVAVEEFGSNFLRIANI